MTDKQIIIDGIDVSGCDFLIIEKDKQLCRCIKADLFGGIEFVENARKGNCKDNSNCYYKNWKRKEQECERLKHDNGYEVGALEKTIDNLKAENETYKKMFEDKDVQLALTEIRSGERRLWYNKVQRLEQTLTEIKEIAESCGWNFGSEILYKRIEQILQKISEVTNEN